MRKQYLHLSAYPCERCEGPVVAASLAVRENEISNESGIRELGGFCLSCSHKQNAAGPTSFTRQFPAVEWEPNLRVEPAETARGVEMDRASRE
jgi:hypothetical protein